MTTERRLLSRKEAAEYLGVSFWTILRHIRKGLIPVVKIGGRALIDKKDLDNLIEVNKITKKPKVEVKYPYEYIKDIHDR